LSAGEGLSPNGFTLSEIRASDTDPSWFVRFEAASIKSVMDDGWWKGSITVKIPQVDRETIEGLNARADAAVRKVLELLRR
jgi:hypothetical protein